MNLDFSRLRTERRELSWVVGRFGSLVSAQGQKPFLRPRQTDLTNGRLGCFFRSFSKRSTLIGVTTLKRCGLFLIVFFATLFLSSLAGGDGKGAANSVANADVTLGMSDFRQIKSGE